MEQSKEMEQSNEMKEQSNGDIKGMERNLKERK